MSQYKSTTTVQKQADSKQDGQKPKKHHLVRNIIIIVAIVVVVLVAALIAAFATGVLAPANAAAKYGTFDYLDEQDVTDYIMTYKKQMGYEDATDDEWAAFLAAYNLTPDRLRLSTIVELMSDIAIEQECKKQGITVSDEEIDAMIQNVIDANYLGDASIFESSLESSGQTMEGYRDVCRRSLLREKLRLTVETPEPTEDEVRAYIEEYAATCQESAAEAAETYEEAEEIREGDGSVLIRHSYCFSYLATGDEPSLSDYNTVEAVRQEFIDDGLGADNFMLVLGMYSNDGDAIAINGEMGWDAGTDEYTTTFERMLNQTAVDSVSNVYTDGDAVCFIYVDKGYTLPYSKEKIEELDLSEMPESLYEYFKDCAGYELWEEASTQYLQDLVSSMDVTLYEMPADVPYNVDMSAYLVEETDESSVGASSDDESSEE